MKNKITITFLLLFIIGSIKAQESAEEKQDRLIRVKCKVKTLILTRTDYTYFGAQLQMGKPYIISKNTFDKSGNFAIVKTFNKNETLDSWQSMQYEKPAFLKSITVHNEDGSINVKAIMKYYYDSLGRPYDLSQFVNDTIFIGKNLYEYKGNDETVVNYYEANPNDRSKMHPTSVEIYKYDSKGRTIEMSRYPTGSSYFSTTNYKYGENGNISQKIIDNYTGVYKYGANGLCSTITYYDKYNNIAYVEKYTYEYFSK